MQYFTEYSVLDPGCSDEHNEFPGIDYMQQGIRVSWVVMTSFCLLTRNLSTCEAFLTQAAPDRHVWTSPRAHCASIVDTLRMAGGKTSTLSCGLDWSVRLAG